MYQVSFFKNVSDPFFFAVTPDETGSVLPRPADWQHWFSQPVYPERALPESELVKLEAGFKKDGYFIYPRKK
jgi:hypothetical protein